MRRSTVLLAALALLLNGATAGAQFFSPIFIPPASSGSPPGPWTLVAHVMTGGSSATSTTTAARDTSTCTSHCLEAVAVGDYNGNALGTLTDSCGGNTWAPSFTHNDTSSNIRTTVYLLYNPTVCASQTFKYQAAASAFASVGGFALTGAINNTVDQSNFADSASSSVTSLALGSITPSSNHSLVLAAMTIGNGGYTGTLTVNHGIMPDTPINYNGGNTFGLAFAYYDQPTAAAVNVTFNWTTAMFASGVVGDVQQ